MFKWLKLVILRAGAGAIVEREYRRRLEIVGGPDSGPFNSITRMIRDAGGNEYDAAAAFATMDAATQFQQGRSNTPLPGHIAVTTIRLTPHMRRPELVADIQERLLEKCNDA